MNLNKESSKHEIQHFMKVWSWVGMEVCRIWKELAEGKEYDQNTFL